MKLLIAIFLCGLLSISEGELSKEAIQFYRLTSDSCKSKFNIEHDIIENFQIYDIPENAKCFGACMMRGLALMTPENKLDKSTYMIGITMMYDGDEENLKKSEQVIDDCASVTDADECEAAFKIGRCISEGKKTAGVPNA